MEHTRFMPDKQGYTRARPRARVPSHSSTHACTHTDEYVILIAFHDKND